AGYVATRIQQATANVLNQFLGPAYQPPAAPSNLAAAAVSSSQINLTWADNASNEAAYTVQRSPNGSTGWTVVTSTLPANTTSYADTGLSPGTYYYQVQASNDNGSSALSNVASAAMPPAAPSNLAATGVSPSQINLTWADNASNETGYTVERSPDGSTGWAVLTSTLPANTTGYADTGLAAGSYSYRVRATNAVGGSPYSNVATGATASQAAEPVVAAAGDIACDPTDLDYNGGLGKNGNCQQKAT